MAESEEKNAEKEKEDPGFSAGVRSKTQFSGVIPSMMAANAGADWK